AVQGMLKELDPHSVLLPPEKSNEMDERFQGFGGIGIWFRIIDESPMFLKTVPVINSDWKEETRLLK
ncbi:hypothetical protein ACFL40_03935, partial [candidate division KSB1 bacterium]